jgi:hypothetical protein
MMKKWSEMSPKQRDRMVAEKIMGYTVRKHGYYDGGFQSSSSVKRPAYYLFDAEGNADWHREHISEVAAWAGCPSYTTDMGAAWSVVRRMDTVHKDRFVPFAVYLGLLTVHLEDVPSPRAFQMNLGRLSKITPEDVCFAALKALGIIKAVI